MTGLLLSAGVTADVRLQYATTNPVPLVLFSLYAGIGILAIGGVAGYLYQRYQAVTPPLVSTVLFADALTRTWWTVRTREEPTVVETIPQPLDQVTTLELLLLGWPPVLSGVILVVGIERYLTRRLLE